MIQLEGLLFAMVWLFFCDLHFYRLPLGFLWDLVSWW